VIETPVWALKIRLRWEALRPAALASSSRPPALGSRCSDDVFAVDERPPGEDQQVGEPGVQQRVIDRVGVADLAQQRIEAPGTAAVEAT
jgi:hypothetical protein